MKFILIIFLIIIISIIIFFILNYLLKKKIENYGVYCGLYNTMTDSKLSCMNDSECTWNTNLAYCTNNSSPNEEHESLFGQLQNDFTSIVHSI